MRIGSQIFVFLTPKGEVKFMLNSVIATLFTKSFVSVYAMVASVYSISSMWLLIRNLENILLCFGSLIISK